MLYQTQSAGGDAPAQPGGRGGGLGSCDRGQRHRGLSVRGLQVTEGAVVSKGFDAENTIIRESFSRKSLRERL